MDILERLLELVKVDANGCFNWQGNKNKAGYGRTGIGQGNKVKLAHRVMFEVCRKPIPRGLLVCHRCDNPGCVNPAHLFVGTNADNCRDAAIKGRSAAGSRIPNAKLKESDIADIVERYNAGETQLAIAQHYKVSRSIVSDVVSGRSWPKVDRPQRSRSSSRLTPSDVAEIRQRLLAGETQCSIATRFSISQCMVSAIKVGRVWKEHP